MGTRFVMSMSASGGKSSPDTLSNMPSSKPASAAIRRTAPGEACSSAIMAEGSNLLIENNVIEEASFTGHGCAISQASADIMADLITGETVEEAHRLAELFLAMIRGEQLSEEDLEDLDEAAQLQDISHMPARVKCAELAWRTLDGMLTGQNNQ